MISSRSLLLSLIALNLLALAWWSGAMSPLSDSVREPQRLEGQIDPDRLKLVGALPAKSVATTAGVSSKTTASGSVESSPAPTPAAPTASLPAQQTPLDSGNPGVVGVLALPFTDKAPIQPPTAIALPSPSPTPTPSGENPSILSASLHLDQPDAALQPEEQQWIQKEPVNPSTGLPMVAAAISGPGSDSSLTAQRNNIETCRRFSDMSYIEAREVEDDLLARGATVELERADTGSYLVYIDPLPTEQLASRRRAQLQRLGVTDLQVIRSGYYRNGISLGLLRSLSLAKKHESNLAALGVSSTRIGPVNVASARYDIVVWSHSPRLSQEIRNHEVLGVMAGTDCDR